MRNDDAELVWRGPFASLPRPMDAGMVRDVATTATLFTGLAALVLVPILAGWTHVHGANRTGLGVIFVSVAAFCLAQFALRSASPQQMEKMHPNTVVPLFLASSVSIGATVYFAGPLAGSVSVFSVELTLLAFLVLRWRWAVAATLVLLIGYGVGLALLDNQPSPTQQFLNVLGSAVACGVLLGGMATRLDQSRHLLADLNRNLEARVAAQVAELERTGRLRRFLSPQIADVVTSEGADEMLAPHRADIAAFFVDLRGFTAFTNAVSADRVMGVLDEYYDAVGSILDAHGATIGGFDGDGVFAYLGDPIANVHAARDAVAMAGEVATRLDVLTAHWSDGPTSLGYGIGMAYGEATLGLVGFANRADYTPVGAVVNLAARLCSDATHREIVIDDALREGAGLDDATRRDDVDLKGFGSVATYRLSR